MNSWNALENHLRNWTPRRPSARLKRRLFGEPGPAPTARAAKLGWTWLMPAAGALLLAAVILTQENPQARAGSHGLLAISNASWAAEYDSHRSGERNVLTTILEWTNSGQSHSSMGPFLLYNTNSLRD